MQKKTNAKGFALVELLIAVAVVLVLGVVGVLVYNHQHKPKAAAVTDSSVTSSKTKTNSTSNKAATTQPTKYTAAEAVDFVQKTYDDYLTAVNNANSASSHTQPVAQVGLAAVKDNLSADLYAKAAAVTQATPFSCTAQYVTDKYTASLSSSDSANAVVAVSISNGGGLYTDGMKVTVDLTSLKITSVVCPS